MIRIATFAAWPFLVVIALVAMLLMWPVLLIIPMSRDDDGKIVAGRRPAKADQR